MKKRCTKCGQFLITELFPINKQTKDGYYSWCKTCKRESESQRNSLKRQNTILKPKTCERCLKSEPDIEFETRHRKLCKECKKITYELVRADRRIKTKICKICGKQKKINKYTSNQCRICNSCFHKPANKKKQLIKKWKHKRKVDRIRRINTKLRVINNHGKECKHCHIRPSKEWPVACFDFHHIEDKDTLISRLLHAKKSRSKELEEELRKCIVLCSNCHRKLHFNESEERYESSD